VRLVFDFCIAPLPQRPGACSAAMLIIVICIQYLMSTCHVDDGGSKDRDLCAAYVAALFAPGCPK
jgi:hypothetical protein